MLPQEKFNVQDFRNVILGILANLLYNIEIEITIAHCRNVRALGRVSYIDWIENLNIKTEMLMNEKLPDQV